MRNRLGTKYFVNFFRYLCNRQNTQKQLDTVFYFDYLSFFYSLAS